MVMKKTIIMLVTIVIFSTIVPPPVLADEGVSDQIVEEIMNEEDRLFIGGKDERNINIESGFAVEHPEQSQNSMHQYPPQEQEKKLIDLEEQDHGQLYNNKSINEEKNYSILETPAKSGFASDLKEAIQNTYFYLNSRYPDVNNYIKQKKFKVAKIEYQHNPDFTKFPYRNGYGAVEGVVAHETGNDRSNILSEIAYMSRNHKRAFVHAFVDHNRIIEIHPTDYGAWGAGRYANERFVHVELVRLHSFDEFARSINNYAYYIAKILYDYGLGVTSAEKTGKGTLWSHYAVTKHLGGTTHVDPHGYFARYGYHWDDFVSLVTEKYNEFVANKIPNTSKLGKLKNGELYIYKNPTNINNRFKAGNQYTGQVYYIKAQAKVGGKTYYLISDRPSSKQGTIGWVEGKDITTHSHKHVDDHAKVFYLKGKGVAYNRPWGGSKNIVYTNQDLAKFKYKRFHVHLTQTVGNNTWYRGRIEGDSKTIWIHSSHVTSMEENTTSRLGKIKGADVKIYKDVLNPNSSFTAGTTHTGMTYFIKKQMKFDDQVFYLISNEPSAQKGVIGWVKASDIDTHSHSGVDNKQKILYLKGKGAAYNRAWGSSKNLVLTSKDLSNFKYKKLIVNLTEKVGNNIWYRGKIEGQGTNIWIHSSHVTAKKESKTSKLGKLNNENVLIYKTVEEPTTAFRAGSMHYGITYFIKRQMTFDDQIYYLISNEPSDQKGVIGWVNAKDIETHDHTSVDNKRKVFYLLGKGAAYNRAWGDKRNLLLTDKDLKQLRGKKLIVNLTERVGKNIWYRGKIEGQGPNIWIHSSHVTTK